MMYSLISWIGVMNERKKLRAEEDGQLNSQARKRWTSIARRAIIYICLGKMFGTPEFLATCKIVTTLNVVYFYFEILKL